MKKIFSIFLSILILTSSTGIAMATHYCHGDAIDIEVMLHPAELGCGMENTKTSPCAPEQHDAYLELQSCCDNEFISIDTDEHNYQLSKSADIIFLAAFVCTFLELYSFEAENQNPFLKYSPPLPDQDIQILHQSFLL